MVRALHQAHMSLADPDSTYAERLDNKPTLVVGRCPTGADAKAEFYAAAWGWAIEPYEADWGRHGKVAGPIRNQEMVDAGADVCLAFYKQGAANVGTSDCVRRAKKAGIPVKEFYEE